MKERYDKLKVLIEKYYTFKKSNADNEMSEEATRVWINDFLAIFGWDVHDLSQVVQEQVVNEQQRDRLGKIESSHSKPDYTLINGKIILMQKKVLLIYLRTKKLHFRFVHMDGLLVFLAHFCQILSSSLF